ncbi:MAG: translation elongation factor Ts [bacterium]
MVSAEQVRELREKTGLGIMECKKALAESQGILEKAIEILRKKGLSSAELKKVRQVKEGIIFSYIHFSNRIGVMLELCCESDFVAKTEDFQNLGKDIVMHIAATNPLYISQSEIPQEIIEKEMEIYKVEMEQQNKPEKIIEQIIKGKLEKYYQMVCLLEQPFVKNGDLTILKLIGEKISKLGENIIIRRFIRYELGK